MQTTAQSYNNLNQKLQAQPNTPSAYQGQNLLSPNSATTIQQGSYTAQQQQFNRTGIPAGVPVPGKIINSGSQANLLNNQGARVIPQPVPGSQKIIPGSTGVIQGGAVTQINSAVPPKPSSTSRVEYIPIQRKVVDYETRQVVSSMWVPVQRKCLNYYAIQHITQYLPRQVDDVRYQMVPEQYVQYKLQYVPVDKQIVHFPHDQNILYNQQFYQHGYGQVGHVGYIGQVGQVGQVGLGYTATTLPQEYHHNQFVTGLPGYQTTTVNQTTNVNIPGFQQLPNTRPLPKSNYVTSDGYVPSYLTQSSNNYTALLGGGASNITTLKTANQQRIPDGSYINDRNFIEGIGSNLRPISKISQQSKPPLPRQTRMTENYESGERERYAFY